MFTAGINFGGRAAVRDTRATIWLCVSVEQALTLQTEAWDAIDPK